MAGEKFPLLPAHARHVLQSSGGEGVVRGTFIYASQRFGVSVGGEILRVARRMLVFSGFCLQRASSLLCLLRQLLHEKSTDSSPHLTGSESNFSRVRDVKREDHPRQVLFVSCILLTVKVMSKTIPTTSTNLKGYTRRLSLAHPPRMRGRSTDGVADKHERCISTKPYQYQFWFPPTRYCCNAILRLTTWLLDV